MTKRAAPKGRTRSKRKTSSRGAASETLAQKYQKYFKPIKKPVTLRLDADVLDWFQRGGGGYQTRINRALRELMLREKKRTGDL